MQLIRHIGVVYQAADDVNIHLPGFFVQHDWLDLENY